MSDDLEHPVYLSLHHFIGYVYVEFNFFILNFKEKNFIRHSLWVSDQLRISPGAEKNRVAVAGFRNMWKNKAQTETWKDFILVELFKISMDGISKPQMLKFTSHI